MSIDWLVRLGKRSKVIWANRLDYFPYFQDGQDGHMTRVARMATWLCWPGWQHDQGGQDGSTARMAEMAIWSGWPGWQHDRNAGDVAFPRGYGYWKKTTFKNRFSYTEGIRTFVTNEHESSHCSPHFCVFKAHAINSIPFLLQ